MDVVIVREKKGKGLSQRTSGDSEKASVSRSSHDTLKPILKVALVADEAAFDIS